MAGRRAAAGGETIGGRAYRGGQFIPQSALDETDGGGGVQVIGLAELQKAIKQAAKRYPAKIGRGLVKAGLLIQRESQKIVPIDTANLKGSAYTRALRHNEQPPADAKIEAEGAEATAATLAAAAAATSQNSFVDVVVGYTAAYAVYVQENLTNRHKPGKEAKYLESAYRRNTNRIKRVILETCKK